MDKKTIYNFLPLHTIYKNREAILQSNSFIYTRPQNKHAQRIGDSEHNKSQRLLLITTRALILRMTFIAVIVLCVLLSFSQTSFAKIPSGLPTGICTNESYNCDADTTVRWLQFQNSAGIDLIPSQYISVGSCSVNGNGKANVNVLLALSRNQGKMYFDAKISFYNQLGRYANTPVSEIESIFPKIYQDRNRLAITKSHAYIDYTEFSPYRYWVRHNRQSNKLFLLVYFGFLNTFLCEFDNTVV